MPPSTIVSTNKDRISLRQISLAFQQKTKNLGRVHNNQEQDAHKRRRYNTMNEWICQEKSDSLFI